MNAAASYLLVLVSASGLQAAEILPSINAIRAAGSAIRPLMRRLPPRDPADAEKPLKPDEIGQTFDQYLASNPNRPNRTRHTIYLQAVGDLDPEAERLIQEIETFLGVAFATTIKRPPPIPLPSIPPALHYVREGWKESGFLATKLLDHVIARPRAKDAVSVLAVTADDLWTGEGLKVVFGRASYEWHTAAISFARMGDPASEPNRVLERVLKVASHELAHTLGVRHCVAFECGMNTTDSVGDLDDRPLAFCAECEMKIWWACRIDPVARTERLLEACAQCELTPAAEEYRRRLQTLHRKR